MNRKLEELKTEANPTFRDFKDPEVTHSTNTKTIKNHTPKHEKLTMREILAKIEAGTITTAEFD